MNVRLTTRAARQIDDILDYIAHRSPQGAARLQRRLAAAFRTLTHQALAGQATDRAGVRRMVLNAYPYVLFYRVRDKDVVVQRMRHAARRPS